MNRKVLHSLTVSMLALLFALAPLASRAGEGGQQKMVGGLTVYIGVLPAEMLLGHPAGHHEREMHGGVPAGTDRYHVVVALFDTASGKRISDAQVRISATALGLAPERKKAEPMLINRTLTYGNYLRLPGAGPYKIGVEIERPGRPKAEVEFDYPFARS